MNKVKLTGRPLRKDVIVTLDVEEKSKSGLILSANEIKGSNKTGKLKDRQTVIAKGDYCDQVVEGDEVLIDFERYLKVENEKRLAGKHNKTYYWAIPILEMDGEKYGRIQESDIFWIFDDKSA